jgi:hypothetical protein
LPGFASSGRTCRETGVFVPERATGTLRIAVSTRAGDLFARDFVSIDGVRGPLTVWLHVGPVSQPAGETVSVAHSCTAPPEARSELGRLEEDFHQGRIYRIHRTLEPGCCASRPNMWRHTSTRVSLCACQGDAARRGPLRAKRQSGRPAPEHTLALALVLVAEDKDLPEALSQVEKSAGEFPNAPLIAARLWARQGDTVRNAAQLRACPASHKPGNGADTRLAPTFTER